MDQNKDSSESNRSIDINEVITVSKNEKKKVARRRWAILAKALKVLRFDPKVWHVHCFI
jgi:hypothetical protein